MVDRFIANMTNAFTTAFGTGSSSATLPVTIKLLEEKNNIDPRVCRYATYRVCRYAAYRVCRYAAYRACR
jgi:hypothetical protein